MTRLHRNLRNRGWLLDRLRAEVVGPDPSTGESAVLVTDSERINFGSWEEFRRPKRQPSGEEILWQDPPTRRYGAGILYPAGVTEERLVSEDSAQPAEDAVEDPGPTPEIDSESEVIAERPAGVEDEDFDVTLANSYRPSAVGISFLARLPAIGSVIVQVSAAWYRKRAATIETAGASRMRELWFRVPITDESGSPPEVRVTPDQLLSNRKTERDVPGCEGLQVVVISRRLAGGEAEDRLVTVSLVNRRRSSGRLDEQCFFQCQLSVRADTEAGWILPYPEVTPEGDDGVTEELINRLLYRDRHTFAVGHGCAAKWSLAGRADPPLATSLSTESLPHTETPPISADVIDGEGRPIRVSMRVLAGLAPEENRYEQIDRLLSAYRGWIDDISDLQNPREVTPGVTRPPVPSNLRPAAEALLARCRLSLSRMEQGYALLRTDPIAGRAFELANEVMLVSQLRSARFVRLPRWNDGAARIEWNRPIEDPDPAEFHPTKGYWRAFQIAFLLMSLEGICHPQGEDREIVDVIWFPTGGGKTEAYLGLTAFTLLYNRLSGRVPGGSTVLMRYTLRLLTTQQFQRAGLLFCALESVRARNQDEVGPREFRLGMWVGGGTTPNKRSEALSKLKALEKNPEAAENPFVLLKCPWCNALFGPPPDHGSRVKVFGYKKKPAGRAHTVAYMCSDRECAFGARYLPVAVIDEDIYEDPPDLIIGTVDKFALIAWKPEIRSIFGIGQDGAHRGLPPTLVIQDELHLIAGPLGSMVGSYEAVIEELCTLRSQGSATRPKIVASTATISRSADQIRALYARLRSEVFPPSGIEAGDSFFSREARAPGGELLPGRLYAGIMAPGHGSLQTTEARVFATLLQWPGLLDDSEDVGSARDPWWTLVAFFNSLRELGGAATLLVADTREYLRVILNRHGQPYERIRMLFHCEELTSRIRDDQVPRAIQKLERNYTPARDAETVDVCLASSIIEVGIDIDRLSLMTITGQPKTTAQYIQVSSRIGRDPDAPGLVVTLYGPSKPRDRSHYERFTSYHQRLYANVEPTSVTPFSPPAVERALHALLVSLVRQTGTQAEASSPRPFPLRPGSRLRDAIHKLLLARVTAVDPGEHGVVAEMLRRRLAEWNAWDPSSYGTFGAQPDDAPLMFPAGLSERPEWNGHGWPTLSSLREVDATCEGQITYYYNEAPGGAAD